MKKFLIRKNLIREFLILLPLIFLAGCYDKVELEKRDFVLSIGFDKTRDGKASVSQAIADVTVMPEQTIKTAEAEDLKEAFEKTAGGGGRRMDYGHTKLCVFSEEFLKDGEMFRESIEILERDREFSREIIVLAADKKAEEILNIVPDELPELSRKSDLQSLLSELHENGEANITRITVEEEEICMDGFAFIRITDGGLQ